MEMYETNETTKQRKTMKTKEVNKAYVEAHIRLQTAIVSLQAMIHDMPAPDEDAKVDYGHVGTVAYLAAKIEELAQ